MVYKGSCKTIGRAHTNYCPCTQWLIPSNWETRRTWVLISRYVVQLAETHTWVSSLSWYDIPTQSPTLSYRHPGAT